MGASVPETGSHPTGQAELHRLDASRFDPARKTLPRPRQYDAPVLELAARKLAERIVEDWDTTGSVDQWITPLTREMRTTRDGYELARELEKYHMVSPDTALVEILDESYSFMREAYEDALRQWVKYTDWKPAFAQGDRVTYRSQDGIVNGINAETSEMYFAPDADAPRYRQGGGYIVSEGDLTASAIEARSDATPKSGAAEGESAASEAGDAQ